MEDEDVSFYEHRSIELLYWALERLRLGVGKPEDMQAITAGYDLCLSLAQKEDVDFDLEILDKVKPAIDSILRKATSNKIWREPFLTLADFERLLDLLELLELHLE